jgi:putative acetyltransferase
VTRICIRPETASDIGAIREVNRAAFEDHPFSQQTEHLIVDALRADGALELSLVAVLNGQVVGHVAFSRACVGDDSSGWYLLGPLAVLPDNQRAGIGIALVEAGLAEIGTLGALGCVLVGDAGYYGRFGFHALPGLGYGGVPDEHVLGLALGERCPTGAIRAHEAFLVTADSDA